MTDVAETIGADEAAGASDEALAVGDILFDNFPYPTGRPRCENRVVEVVAIEGSSPDECITVRLVGGHIISDAARSTPNVMSRETLRDWYRPLPEDFEVVAYRPPV
jgi:hypothetical protein